MEFTNIIIEPVKWNPRGFFNEVCELGQQDGWEVVGITKHNRRVILGQAATQKSALAFAAGHSTEVTHGVWNHFNKGSSITQRVPSDTQLIYGSHSDFPPTKAYGIRRVSEEQWDVIQVDENKRGETNEPVVISTHPEWGQANGAAVLKMDGVVLPSDNLDSEYTD